MTDLHRIIEEKYPKLIAEDNIGIDCGEGWNNIVLQFCEKIKDQNARIAQIKEKFGLLRIYVDKGNKTVTEACSEAERQSSKVCEYCGSKENIKREGSWLKTLCESCRKTR